MKKKILDKRMIAAIRRRRFMMYADGGGASEPKWNMRVVAHPEDGYSMPQTTGNFTLVKQDGDTYYYQHDGSDSTGNGVLYVSGQTTHFGITDVEFSDCEHITKIGDKFLYWCNMLETINLSEFSNVEEIGKEFLRECHSLLQIDLSPLSKTTTIGNDFLSACRALTTIDLSPLSGASIDTDYFLYGCSNLVSIDLTPLADTTTTIGVCFLRDCNSLTSIDLSPLERASTIGLSFLYGCSSLEYVDLSRLVNISSIGTYFLYNCAKLTSIKVPWTTIPTTSSIDFMLGVPSTCSIEVPCEALSTYKSTSPWSSRADYINGGEGCEEPEPEWNMKVVANPEDGYSMPTTTGNFTLVEQDGNEYFYQHDGSNTTGDLVLYVSGQTTHFGITDVVFKDCEHITSIGNSFLRDVNKIKSLNIEQFANVTSVGTAFLSDCYALESIDPTPLRHIGSFRDYFMDGCRAIKSLDFSMFDRVSYIGQAFLRDCIALEYLDLSNKINYYSNSKYFLYNCRRLVYIKATNWFNPPSAGYTDGFMYSVPQNCQIVVDCDIVDKFKTTSPWSGRADYYTCVEKEPPQNWNIKATLNDKSSSITNYTINGTTLISVVGNDLYYRINDGVTVLENPLPNVTMRDGVIGIEFNDCGSILEFGNYFCGCTSSLRTTKISSLDLSAFNNVNKINAYFLQYAKRLTSLKVPWTTIPTTSTSSFMDGVPSTCNIEVPCEAVDTYKSTTPWSNRASKIIGDC